MQAPRRSHFFFFNLRSLLLAMEGVDAGQVSPAGAAPVLAQLINSILPFLSDLEGIQLCESVCGAIYRANRDERYWKHRMTVACPLFTELRKWMMEDGARSGESKDLLPGFVRMRYFHAMVDCRTGKRRNERQLARFFLIVASWEFAEEGAPKPQAFLGDFIPNVNPNCCGVTKWCLISHVRPIFTQPPFVNQSILSQVRVRADPGSSLEAFYRRQLNHVFPAHRHEQVACMCCEICSNCGISQTRQSQTEMNRCCGTCMQHIPWAYFQSLSRRDIRENVWFHSLCEDCRTTTNLMKPCLENVSGNCQGLWCAYCDPGRSHVNTCFYCDDFIQIQEEHMDT